MALLSVPLKTVISYWADVQNEANLVTTLAGQGYAICDGSTLDASHQDINAGGTYTLPDLRNKFLLGADVTKTAGQAGAAVGSGNESVAAGAPGPKGTGGENSHTLSTAELAAHNHGVTDSGHSHSYIDPQGNSGGVEHGISTHTTVGDPHTVWNDGAIVSRVTGITVNNAGSGNAHENRGSYFGIIYAMKVRY